MEILLKLNNFILNYPIYFVIGITIFGFLTVRTNRLLYEAVEELLDEQERDQIYIEKLEKTLLEIIINE